MMAQMTFYIKSIDDVDIFARVYQGKIDTVHAMQRVPCKGWYPEYAYVYAETPAEYKTLVDHKPFVLQGMGFTVDGYYDHK